MDNNILIAASFGIGLLLIIILYFVFSCSSEESNCEQDSDCCEDLVCTQSKCSQKEIENTVTTTPMIFNDFDDLLKCNSHTCSQGKNKKFKSESLLCGDECSDIKCCEDIKCGDWSIDNNCGLNKIIENVDKIGNSLEECCRDITCSDWLKTDQCLENRMQVDDISIKGNSEDVCCRDIKCDDWKTKNNCLENRMLKEDTDIIGNSEETCCRDITCVDWRDFQGCPYGKKPSYYNGIGNSANTCCNDISCFEWDRLDDTEGNACPEGSRISSYIMGSSIEDCCSPIKCGYWAANNPGGCGEGQDIKYFDLEGNSKEECCTT